MQIADFYYRESDIICCRSDTTMARREHKQRNNTAGSSSTDRQRDGNHGGRNKALLCVLLNPECYSSALLINVIIGCSTSKAVIIFFTRFLSVRLASNHSLLLFFFKSFRNFTVDGCSIFKNTEENFLPAARSKKDKQSICFIK